MSRERLTLNFLSSTEFRISTGARLISAILYFALLTRDSSLTERMTIVQALNSGTSVRTVLEQFVNGVELQTVLQ